MKRNMIYLVAGGIFGFLVGYLSLRQQSAQTIQIQEPEPQQALSQSLTIPEGAQQLSECVPNMGFHWANPADLPFGPIYLTDGELALGIEYMIDEEQLETTQLVETHDGQLEVGPEIAMTVPGVSFDHLDLQYFPDGHEAYEVPHYDIHAYTISQEDRQELCL